MATNRTLYDVLGVAQDASLDVVRKAYKRKVLQTHPDKQPPGAPEYQRRLAETRFRDVCAAFDILSDTAKRKVYDNGLNYIRGRAQHDEVQAKLARERDEWAREAKERHVERMRARSEQMQASAQKHQENLAKAEIKYREKMQALEEELRRSKENMQQIRDEMRQAASSPTSEAQTYKLAEDILRDMRKSNPEWETRRQAAMNRQRDWKDGGGTRTRT